MNTTEQLTRIESARNTLRNKGVNLGISTTTALLDELAGDFDEIENRGAVSATVREGETYNIPKGYHNGAGTVSGVAGGGNYSLQSKTVTPTKKQQSITPDNGYYGLSDVTIGAIPESYHDVSSVTAGEDDVLANKIIVDPTGKVTAGAMPNNGAVDKTITPADPTYTVPKGYHNGTGKVKMVTEAKTATPTKSSQTVSPSSGKTLASVTVEPIPDKYQDISGVTAKPAGVLDGDFFVDAEGNMTEGTMPNRGAVAASIDGLSTLSYTIPAGYHDGTGTVSLTDDIERALAAI